MLTIHYKTLDPIRPGQWSRYLFLDLDGGRIILRGEDRKLRLRDGAACAWNDYAGHAKAFRIATGPADECEQWAADALAFYRDPRPLSLKLPQHLPNPLLPLLLSYFGPADFVDGNAAGRACGSFGSKRKIKPVELSEDEAERVRARVSELVGS
jgi:hypothetical protein